MKFQQRDYQSKTGQIYMIREALSSEAKKILALKHRYLNDAETIPLEPGEYKLTVSEEEALIRQYVETENQLLLIAEHNGQFVGNIDLTGSDRKRLQHTAMLGMGIEAAHRGQGLGTALLQASLDWARQSAVLELIWLEVYANNEAGLRLYEKCGFTYSGTMPQFFKHGKSYFDKVSMYMRV